MRDLFLVFSRFTPQDIAAKDAATANNRAEAERLRKLGAKLEAVAFGVGLAGNWDYGVYLRAQNPQCLQLANIMALGFEIGGHHHSAMKIKFEENISYEAMTLGMAIRGDKVGLQYLSQKARLDTGVLAIGAILGGDILWAEFLRQNEEKFFERKNPPLTQWMAHVAYANGSTEYARFLQGTQLTAGPSDTPDYARRTDLLPQTFFCSHKPDKPRPTDAAPERPHQLRPLRAQTKPKTATKVEEPSEMPRTPGIFSHATRVVTQKATPHHSSRLAPDIQKEKMPKKYVALPSIKKQPIQVDSSSSDDDSFHLSSSSGSFRL